MTQLTKQYVKDENNNEIDSTLLKRGLYAGGEVGLVKMLGNNNLYYNGNKNNNKVVNIIASINNNDNDNDNNLYCYNYLILKKGRRML